MDFIIVPIIVFMVGFVRIQVYRKDAGETSCSETLQEVIHEVEQGTRSVANLTVGNNLCLKREPGAFMLIVKQFGLR